MTALPPHLADLSSVRVTALASLHVTAMRLAEDITDGEPVPCPASVADFIRISGRPVDPDGELIAIRDVYDAAEAIEVIAYLTRGDGLRVVFERSVWEGCA